MTNPDHAPNDDASLTRAIETTIRIGVVALLAAWCFQITMPFIVPIVWGIIIATAVYPGFLVLKRALGERRRLAAALVTLVALSILIAPMIMFVGSFVDSAQWLAGGLNKGTLQVPPPPESVASWPLIGEPLHEIWQLASVNLEAALQEIGPYLTRYFGGVLSTAAGAGLGILQFVISILLSGVLLASADRGQRTAQAIATKLAGARGSEFAHLASATVRGVAQGILGVALIQAFLLGVGLFSVGVPHASLWTLLCLLFAVIQIPTFLIVLPIIVYVFTSTSTITAVAFTIWMALAGASDNLLKPILLARGVDLPMVVIFLGAIGGFMASGFIGLFVGAVVLALGYKLFMAWLAEDLRPVDEGEPNPED